MNNSTENNINKLHFFNKWLLDDGQTKRRLDLINKEIAHIKGRSKILNSYYSKPIIPIKMLYILASLKPISDTMLFDVVWDNALIPHWINNKMERKWDESINPAFKYLIEFISSEFYTQSLTERIIPGDEVLIFENQQIPISVNAIQKFIKLTNATPLTYSDVIKIQKEFEIYKKNWHSPKDKKPKSLSTYKQKS